MTMSESGKAVKAVITRNGKVLLKACGEEVIELCRRSEYGTFNKEGVLLDSLEAVFLFERGKITLFLHDELKELSVLDAMLFFSHTEKDFWIKYLVYSDLRKRGYIVKRGFSRGLDFMIKRRGAKVFEYLVSIVREGERIDFKALSGILEKALRVGKELIISIVDKEGNISYYTLSKLF